MNIQDYGQAPGVFLLYIVVGSVLWQLRASKRLQRWVVNIRASQAGGAAVVVDFI